MVRSELPLMKRVGGEFDSLTEERDSVLAMDIDDADDVEPLELFGESIHPPDSKKLLDRDFFNSFQDDFDDADIN